MFNNGLNKGLLHHSISSISTESLSECWQPGFSYSDKILGNSSLCNLNCLKVYLLLFISCSVVSDSATPWNACQVFTSSWSLLKLTSTESLMPSNHLGPYCPFSLPSTFPSIKIFFNDSALCIRRPKYCSFSFSITPYNEYSGLISFRINCFDLLAVQGTLKSLLQHHSSKASILQCSGFLMVQLSLCPWLLGKPKLLLYAPLSAK